MLDVTHLHLVVNHVSLFFIPIGLAFYFLSQEQRTKKLALALMLVGSLFTVVASQTGEQAEEAQENSANFNEQQAENHEEASEAAQVLSVMLGFLTILLFVWPQVQYFRWGVAVLGVLTTLSLAWTAFQGGQIRHGGSPPGSTQGED